MIFCVNNEIQTFPIFPGHPVLLYIWFNKYFFLLWDTWYLCYLVNMYFLLLRDTLHCCIFTLICISSFAGTPCIIVIWFVIYFSFIAGHLVLLYIWFNMYFFLWLKAIWSFTDTYTNSYINTK